MAPKNGIGDVESLQLDDFRPGYPRFATLLTGDPSYYIFRRFSPATAFTSSVSKGVTNLYSESLKLSDSWKCVFISM